MYNNNIYTNNKNVLILLKLLLKRKINIIDIIIDIIKMSKCEKSRPIFNPVN